MKKNLYFKTSILLKGKDKNVFKAFKRIVNISFLESDINSHHDQSIVRIPDSLILKPLRIKAMGGGGEDRPGNNLKIRIVCQRRGKFNRVVNKQGRYIFKGKNGKQTK